MSNARNKFSPEVRERTNSGPHVRSQPDSGYCQTSCLATDLSDSPERHLMDRNLGKLTIEATHGYVRFQGFQSETGQSGYDNISVIAWSVLVA